MGKIEQLFKKSQMKSDSIFEKYTKANCSNTD